MFSLYYIVFIIAGSFLAHRYHMHTKRFLWWEYWALLAAPLLGVVGLAFIFGPKVFLVFLLGMTIFPILEWFTGYAYLKMMNVRLWEYNRYTLPGRHTSWLTLPIWGAGMVLLWLIFHRY